MRYNTYIKRKLKRHRYSYILQLLPLLLLLLFLRITAATTFLYNRNSSEGAIEGDLGHT